jgi:hypothetical protein
LANRIADTVEDIEQNIEDLQHLQGLLREAYRTEQNQLQRDAVEGKFEKLTAAVIDIVETILRAEDVAAPDNRKVTITAVARRKPIGFSRRVKPTTGNLSTFMKTIEANIDRPDDVSPPSR